MGFSYLVPIMVEEVLPGDTWKAHITTVARTAVPIVPLMDNWHLNTFAFFVPNRLLWTNWVKFMGEQDNPETQSATPSRYATRRPATQSQACKTIWA